MTPVGHSLMGLTIATVAMPRDWSVRARVVTYATFVVLANAPDIPLPNWGHDRYDISHSVFVTAAATALVAIVVPLIAGAGRISWQLYVAGVTAWYSHLLLDTTYNHGKGLAVFWPFGSGRIALPIPWFSIMRPHDLFSAHNYQVWAIEAVVYGAILAIVLLGRKAWDRTEAAKTHPARI
jgi:hypothetical protein